MAKAKAKPRSTPKATHIDVNITGSVYGTVNISLGSIPPHPLSNGKPFAAPTLPPNFIPRPQIMDIVREAVLSKHSVALTALHGFGGVGKTVVAKALCYDKQIKKTFPDGIIWMTLGRQPGDILPRLAAIGALLGDAAIYYPTLESATSRLRKILEKRAVLIILDDVWSNRDLDPFQFAGPKCRILITTRMGTIADHVNAKRVELNVLDRPQAIELLRKAAGHDDPAFGEIADRLGCHPLALELAGVRLRHGLTARHWLETFQRIIDIAPPGFDDLKGTIKLSVDSLPGPEANLYYTLGVFPEDLWIPQAVVIRFWKALNRELSDGQCEAVLQDMENLALIERNQGNTLSLHDLLHDFTRNQLIDSGEHEKSQNQLLAAYNSDPAAQPWYEVASVDDYLPYHLPYHMICAGRKEELFHILTSVVEWLPHKLATGANPALEQMLLRIWELYWDDDKNHESAKRLFRRWLSWKAPSDAPVALMTWLARGTFYVRYDEGLIAILMHRDARLRTAGIAQAYFRYRQDPSAAIAILEKVASHLTFAGLPRMNAVRTTFDLLLMFMTYEYQARGAQADVAQLTRIGVRAIQKLLFINPPLLRPVGRLLRGTILTFGANFVVERLATARPQRAQDSDEPARTNVNYEEFQLLLKHSQDPDSAARRVLPYLDPQHGAFEDVPVEDLLACYNGTLTFWIAEYVLLAHGVRTPAAVMPAARAIFDYKGAPEWRDARQISMSFLLRRMLIQQAQIEDQWLKFAQKMCRDYYSDLGREFGIYRSQLGRAEYFPIAYYSEIFNRAHPLEPVDLLDDLFKIAVDTHNTRLLSHLFKSFTDPRVFLVEGLPVVQQLTTNLTLHTEEPAVRRLGVMAIARLRSRQQDSVDAFLSHFKFTDQSVIGQIRALSYGDLPHDIRLATGDMLSSILAYPPPEIAGWLVSTLGMAMDTGDLRKALKLLLSRFFDIVEQN